MASKNQKNDRWEKLKTHYRLNIMNNETFEEVGSYKLSLMNIYVLLCTLLFLGAGLVLLLVLFTPLKKWIPGYQDVRYNTEFLKMERKVQDMEIVLAEYKTYTDKLAKIVTVVPGSEEGANPNTEEISKSRQNTITTSLEPPELDVPTTANQQRDMGINLTQKESYINLRSLNNLYLIPPVSGEISAGFMVDKDHFGVDVLAPRNTPVKSILDGFVISSDWTLETGNTIGIQHDNDMISFYKHNSQLLKSIGDPVRAGEAVAIIGNTGTLSDGPHLHFELWLQGKPIDPEDYIRF